MDYLCLYIYHFINYLLDSFITDYIKFIDAIMKKKILNLYVQRLVLKCNTIIN